MKKQWTGFQSIIATYIERFIAYKRALGRRYHSTENSLRLLDRYLVKAGIQQPCDITPELIENFLASRPHRSHSSYNHLLRAVRRLFNWMVIQEVLECSPVKVHSKREVSQRTPFIFDIHSAKRLLDVARRLPDRPKGPMRGMIYHTIFAILYGLGLRVGEVCRLKIEDVDFSRKLLVIKQTKFYKNRLVPFGPKLEALLREYLQIRNTKVDIASPDAPFFSFTQHEKIHPGTVSQTFHRLVPRLKLDVPLGCSPPTLHCLRHSFAVGTLTRWYRSGINPGTELLKLSTFLGHVDISSTAVYLTMTPALLQEASQRFERFTAPLITEEANQ
jgi:site-specific recombinase XerD